VTVLPFSRGPGSLHGSVWPSKILYQRFASTRLVIMADAGRDVTEQEAEMVSYSKDANSRAQSFNTLNKDFSVGADAVPNLDHDPILPGRRRMLLLACMCILGRSRSFPAHLKHGANNMSVGTTAISQCFVSQATSCVRGGSQAVWLLSPAAAPAGHFLCRHDKSRDLRTQLASIML
jgi:hypothetical protein